MMATGHCRCPHCRCDKALFDRAATICWSCTSGNHPSGPDLAGRRYDAGGPGVIWRGQVPFASRRQARSDARATANSLGHDLAHFYLYAMPGKVFGATCRRCGAAALIDESRAQVSGDALIASCGWPRP